MERGCSGKWKFGNGTNGFIFHGLFFLQGARGIFLIPLRVLWLAWANGQKEDGLYRRVCVLRLPARLRSLLFIEDYEDNKKGSFAEIPGGFPRPTGCRDSPMSFVMIALRRRTTRPRIYASNYVVAGCFMWCQCREGLVPLDIPIDYARIFPTKPIYLTPSQAHPHPPSSTPPTPRTTSHPLPPP